MDNTSLFAEFFRSLRIDVDVSLHPHMGLHPGCLACISQWHTSI